MVIIGGPQITPGLRSPKNGPQLHPGTDFYFQKYIAVRSSVRRLVVEPDRPRDWPPVMAECAWQSQY
eukprot:1139265-Pelagomonas_calceolata.AAC.2